MLGPRLLSAGAEPVAVGLPVDTALDTAEHLRDKVGHVAEHVVRPVAGHVLERYAPQTLVRSGSEEVTGTAGVTRRVRPLAQQAVDAVLVQTMAENVNDVRGGHCAPAVEHLRGAADRSQEHEALV